MSTIQSRRPENKAKKSYYVEPTILAWPGLKIHRNKEYNTSTGSPSSKYEHRRASVLLRNIQNIRICKGKKPIVSVTYDYERISLKNSLEDDFVGCRSFRSSTSRQWLEKSSKHVGSNFTLKPKTKASSLQFCKTEINADIGGKKKRNKRRIYGLLVNGRDLRHYTKQVKSRAGERFIHETHSFMSVSFYTYLCMSVFTTSFGWY